MINNSQTLLISYLNKANINKCYEKAITKALVIYQLKPYNILKLSPQQTFQIYMQIHKKFYAASVFMEVDSWAENQLKIFVWFVIVYAFIQDKTIEELNTNDWNILSLIFYGKSAVTLQFQTLCLMRHKRFKKWAQQEIKLLTDAISERQEKNKWNQIAKQIFIRSNKKYFRTPKQCRQHWFNHLDPTKLKTQWTIIQDYQLIKSIIRNGRKWSRVAKEIGNHRTQHMVKNRFKSLLNLQIKRLNDADIQQFLINKIKQRLQCNNQIRRYILEQQRKQQKDQSMLAQLNLHQPSQKSSSTHIVAYLRQQQTQKQINNKQIKISNEIEQNNKNQQNINDQIWILKQQAQIDELDVQELFNSEKFQNCQEDNIKFFTQC